MIWLLLACAPEPGDTDRPDTGLEIVPDDTGEPIVPDEPIGCVPVPDGEPTHYVEGDHVRFTVVCSGEVATAGTVFRPQNLPEGATFDEETRTFDWATDDTDGARVDLTFQLNRDLLVGTETLTFWVADDPLSPENDPPDPLTYTEEWGVPVLHVNTTVTPGEDYADAIVTWYGRSYPAEMKLHGRTSTHYPKQSYALKFPDDELPVDLWGVTRDHLYLITPFDDNSYIRQRLTFDVWAGMAEAARAQRLTPRCDYVVVYLDRRYAGLYFLEDRVDDEFLDQMGFDRTANLYKAITPDANYYSYGEDGVPKDTWHDGYEKEEGEPVDDFADLDAFIAFTGGAEDSAALVAGLPQHVDVNEFIDLFLLLHYTNAEDSANKNTYLYSSPQSTIFRVTPWDFNASWGQNWRTYRRGYDVDNKFESINRIFAALLEEPTTNAAIWARLAELRDAGPLDPAWQAARLDEVYGRIDDSARRDWSMWGPSYLEYDGWAEYREEHGDWTDYDGEKAYVYQWIADRGAHYAALYP